MTYQDTAKLNQLWATLLVEELTRIGICHFCCAPGSRNTPLSLAVGEHEHTKLHMHFDERGLAFHALGFAQATGLPAVVMCTSGSAVANFWPAVVEAAQARVPLILLTADRPPELLGCGANQAIDQVNLYGTYVRASYHLSCPTNDIAPEYLLTTIDEAVHRAIRAPKGPVRINCPFREPLVPTEEGGSISIPPHLLDWWRGNASYTKWHAPQCVLADEAYLKLSDVFASIGVVQKRTLVPPEKMDAWLVVGRLSNSDEIEAVRDLAAHLRWPVFPDILSGLRTGVTDSHWVSQYDLLLLNDEWRNTHPPHLVLHLGGPITSKRMLTCLAATKPTYIHVSDSPLRQDPNHQVNVRIESDLVSFCNDFCARFTAEESGVAPVWERELAGTNSQLSETIDTFLQQEPSLSEIHVARLVSRLRPANTTLFLGNSMPIRDMDSFAYPGGKSGLVFANRGASGIDGNLATAVAHAIAQQRPLTIVIGDLAALHDLNSLALYRNLEIPVALVVINNDGGGIFSFLPVANTPKHFETCFGVPHGLKFCDAARMFGLAYEAPQSIAQFEDVYCQAICTLGTTLIEVCTDRKQNADLHHKLYDTVRVCSVEVRL